MHIIFVSYHISKILFFFKVAAMMKTRSALDLHVVYLIFALNFVQFLKESLMSIFSPRYHKKMVTSVVKNVKSTFLNTK